MQAELFGRSRVITLGKIPRCEAVSLQDFKIISETCFLDKDNTPTLYCSRFCDRRQFLRPRLRQMRKRSFLAPVRSSAEKEANVRAPCTKWVI